ncbi:small-conductance mechanosensitive channel [Cylindrospermum stagnale PCC 7417]|uniref:Small-conductance mechanosensitive channel n=1 Tax=Cylindrospermum stagnale PCC 7417 TaxID=56107 RepID=K9X397_9NOST|nr:mechanosensitive ion channel family protein [Cylindrospermum stagnale]AFZ26172.1 small-conductance mechanosensitive channel [Cylindrospermum stagnale PCC 7417]
MLQKVLPFEINTWAFIASSLLISIAGGMLIYFILFYILRSIFRKFERDIALVTLNVSTYPALAIFVLAVLKLTCERLPSVQIIDSFENLISVGLIIGISYWIVQLFIQVFIYYLKDYTQQTEAMWDDVLLPLLEAVVPVVVYLIASVLSLRLLGVDLTGIWVTLGGATFVIGFAAQGILANFFSGVVLLIDTPFQFGDVLRLDDGSIAILGKIGVRVTQLYIPDKHCDIYIPNSNLQSQSIVNLSRPTSYYHYSNQVEVLVDHDLCDVKLAMKEIILAHPDTLGDIDTKLNMIDSHYQINELIKQQEIGKLRLNSELAVILKLEEIQQGLEALVVTLQFAEKGGLTEDEIENVQLEYREIMTLIGLKAVTEKQNNRAVYTLQEVRDKDSLIELVRRWYRIWIRDPNLLDDDSYMISEEWERKINILKRRSQRLYQKISNPRSEETRIDDYVMELNEWFQKRFKEPRQKWQEPQIIIKGTNHSDDGVTYVEFKLNFFVDDIKLENGRRGERVSSQIYQEILEYLKSKNVNLANSLKQH